MVQIGNSSTHLTRLSGSDIIWLATASPQGKPHLIPIWFVIHDETIWVCTGSHSKKVRNIQSNPFVSISLEDGKKPLMGEGKATLVEVFTDPVIQLFKEKYDWDLDPKSQYDLLFQIRISRWVLS